MIKKTTIGDIAKKLNLTPATISRALSNKNDISEKTKKRVLTTAKRLNYHPNKIASSLRSGVTHVIGILIPSAEHSFFGSVINGITGIANENGYDVLIYQSNESQEFEKKGLQTFVSARVDGILVSIARDTTDYSHFLDIKKRNIPMVFFDRDNDKLGIPSIVIDDHLGAYLATEHLIKQGYTRIAHISAPLHIGPFKERLRGYKDALKENNIKFEPALLFKGNLTIDSGREGIDYLLKLKEPPDAVFAAEDYTALGAIRELKNHNIKIPEEFGVIGFCNALFCDHITPGLSTIDQQTFKMGQESFKLLFDLIKNKSSKKSQVTKVILEPVLVTRSSTLRKA